jgi:hypothetical protein
MTIERLLEAGRAFDAGELDRAHAIYRQVAEADPRNSIARVGLARVALRRGDEGEAVRHAESAQSIDPENVAARKLVDASRGRGAASEGGAGGAATVPPGEPTNATAPATSDAVEDWPWPDLDEQLERYRERSPGLLGRLFRRGRHP